MTPDQVTDFSASLRAAIRSQSVAFQASIEVVGRAVLFLVNEGNIVVAKQLVTDTPNPPTSGLTDEQFAAMKMQILAMFPN